MGRKRARKKERRAAQRGSRGWGNPTLDFEADTFANDMLLAFMPEWEREERTVVAACGSCLEFVEDGEGGRGTCLHPASGVLSPWSDTQACAFWSRR